MNFFAVMLEGTGVRLELQDESDPAIGFYCTRWIKAPSAALAAELSKAEVLSEWTPNGKYGSPNKGQMPFLSVESVRKISSFRYFFRRKPAGYSFYTSD